MLFSLVYVSRAANPMKQRELLEILQQARTRNISARLTGILLYRDGTFLQLLEGRQDRVESLYEAIQADPRHHEVTTVWTRHQQDRQFPEWSMGFSNLDEEPVEVEGFSDVLDRPDPTQPEAGLVRELLELFDTRR